MMTDRDSAPHHPMGILYLVLQKPVRTMPMALSLTLQPLPHQTIELASSASLHLLKLEFNAGNRDSLEKQRVRVSTRVWR